MHIPHGDPLLVHKMMLHEVRCQQIFEMGRFLFDVEGIQLGFGETEYILICGLKVGPYVDLLHDEKVQSNSNLRARLFPEISDARLRLKNLEDLIMSPNYLALQDEDDVMLIQLVFMLKGLHGRDVKTGIPAAVYKLADNIDDWNRFAWSTYLWKYTSRMMREMFKKIEEFREFKEANPELKKVHKYTVPGFMLPFKIWILETFPEATKFYIRTPTELPRMRVWRSKTPLNWVQCCRIMNVSVPNNEPINVEANPEELMLPFYVRYVNWTLNPVESPPRQHSPVRNSPPPVSSPARRRMYKSEIQTSSTESATNASSSQHLETETSYMSHDTSRLEKKKKTSTKALVKRLLGVVADLSSKVDRVLQKKDEPDTNFEPDRRFREEEEMMNEEEEDTHFDYDNIGSHGLDGEFESTPTHVEPSLDVGEHHTKEMTPIVRPQRKRGVPWYQRTPFTVVLFPINVPHAHWFLAVLHLDIWKVHIYDSTRCMNYFTTYLTGGEFKSFGDSIIEELDGIDYWKDFPDGHKENAVVEFIDIVDAPQQEYIANRGDCGVFVSMYMEMIASGVPVKSDKSCRDARFLYRNRMTNIIWDTK
ncbi:unnamed protein product [Lactuca virosa]|uniref:Ubiquitin-like protease family profile domain-containing protein n=1 Tax=Lactuca virosa TaxID=75947 RepID=A0AAU9NY26_9ASTR|nr:unnamed protein product [Lactuca virosa]